MKRAGLTALALFLFSSISACGVLFVDTEKGQLYESCAHRSCIAGLYCVNDRCSEPSVEGGICYTELPCQKGKGLECRNGKCVKAEDGDPDTFDGDSEADTSDGDAAPIIQWVYSEPAKLQFAKRETTVDQYAACVQAGSCTKPYDKSVNKYCNWDYDDRGNHPLNCVDWNQATTFCEWAGGRLPTEEEWFSEASNGNSRSYPWGNQEVSCDYAVMSKGDASDAKNWGCDKVSTWPVCRKSAGNSVSGLCDMSGNVWEWTSSSEENYRVLRGGAWNYYKSDSLRASGRLRDDPARRYFGYGFRCVRSSR